MEKLIVFLMLFIGVKSVAKDKILFTYDTVGNQIHPIRDTKKNKSKRV